MDLYYLWRQHTDVASFFTQDRRSEEEITEICLWNSNSNALSTRSQVSHKTEIFYTVWFVIHT